MDVLLPEWKILPGFPEFGLEVDQPCSASQARLETSSSQSPAFFASYLQ